VQKYATGNIARNPLEEEAEFYVVSFEDASLLRRELSSSDLGG